MPKPVRSDRTSVFGGGGEQQGSPAPDFFSVDKANRVYEEGAHSGLFTDEAFISPDTKRAQQLEQQLLALQQQIEQQGTSGLAVQDGTLVVEGFQLSPTGLIAPENFSQQSWEQIGQLLFKLEGSIQWLIGDWLVYGEVRWGDATTTAERLGYEANTLWSYASVCRAIQPLIRIKDLSFAHHRLVMAMPTEQQVYALSGAAHFGFSVADFRKWIKQGMSAEGLREELRGGEQHANQSSGNEQNYKIVSAQYEKWRTVDPLKAKPQDRERARFASEEMRRDLEEFNRKWGFE